MQQVTGVYRLHEDEAVQRLAAHTKDLQVVPNSPPLIAPITPCMLHIWLGVGDPSADCSKHVQAKTFRRPITKVKCQLETDAAVECYKKNSADPLSCWKMVVRSAARFSAIFSTVWRHFVAVVASALPSYRWCVRQRIAIWVT